MRWCKNIRALAPCLALLIVLGMGTTLRLIFPNDIEWKGDEQWTFAHAQAMAAGGPWPALGMAMSVGPPNPGMSVWVFAGLFRLFGVTSPPELARAVQCLNSVALVAFAAFAFIAMPKPRREYWWWAAALWAVNPVAIIFERKIWPPSVLPLGTVAFLAAWWYRRYAAAAFAWGFTGALMAQVHISAAIFAVAVALWTLIHDRADFPWKGFVAGGVLGTATALPWLSEMLQHRGAAALNWQSLTPAFYGRWFLQPFGFGIEYTLWRKDMLDYLSGPVLAGPHTYLMALVHLVLAALVVIVLIGAVRVSRLKGWPEAYAIFLGNSSETVLIGAAFWGFGGLLTLLTFANVESQRHYMIVAAPLMALWAALAVFYGDRSPARRCARTILGALCIAQALASLGLLFYIHRTSVISGEYGASWRSQQQGLAAPASQ